ncbi:MAG: iron ABC transporter permease [Planctomycetota bacterium]|nr:iron ABC transporter permease [Planctomycetota bacterium]MDA1106579.1 iron ABC transporter permease [Planctomycetota bacterium]
MPISRIRGRSGGGRRFAALLSMVAFVIVARLCVARSLDGGLLLGFGDAQISALRWGAVLSASLAGAALGMAGLFLQALLRNPLAAPGILGVTSGASLGVTLVSIGAMAGGGWTAVASEAGVPLEVVGAVIGALLTMAIVWGMAMRRGGIDPIAVILGGVVLGALLGSLAMGLQWAMPPHSRASVSLWMMGRVPEVLSMPVVVASALAVVTTGLYGWANATAVDALATGEAEARSLGVPVASLRRGLLVGAGVLSGCAVALCGPVAFVGFVAPHLARAILGPRMNALVVGAPLCGVIVMVGADVARVLIPTSQGRVPIGVVTALVGGVWFLKMLGRGRRAWA